MTSPHFDAKMRRIAGSAPHDCIWCDECCRWEEAGWFSHPWAEEPPTLQGRLLRWLIGRLPDVLGCLAKRRRWPELSLIIRWLCVLVVRAHAWLYFQHQYEFARWNRRTGRLVSRRPVKWDA